MDSSSIDLLTIKNQVERKEKFEQLTENAEEHLKSNKLSIDNR